MATIISIDDREEFLALPEDDGVERELIRGELSGTADDDAKLCRTSRTSSIGSARHYLMGSTRATCSREVASSEARLGSASAAIPLTIVGVDVAYISAEARRHIRARPRCCRWASRPGRRDAVSSDNVEEILDKVDEYLDAGVPLVWEVEPRSPTR